MVCVGCTHSTVHFGAMCCTVMIIGGDEEMCGRCVSCWDIKIDKHAHVCGEADENGALIDMHEGQQSQPERGEGGVGLEMLLLREW